MTPAFSWQSVVTPEARAKLLSGPYTSPAMASLHAVAIAADGSVWAQWAAGCQWVGTPDAEKLAANMLLAEVERLRAMVPPPPVVEWFPTTVGWAARVGMFWLGVGPGGWTLRIRLPQGLGIGDLVESGPETGPAGKSKAVAAWQRACGGAQ
jgi:hypothetical protein